MVTKEKTSKKPNKKCGYWIEGGTPSTVNVYSESAENQTGPLSYTIVLLLQK
uniref:Uncharacterized protein n=1 Tax=Anguilla anguilla TaxID=7936 RepID=A0A0E9QR91_ANGAN